MTHEDLVEQAIHWLRRIRCGIVLSEQACASGEVPDAIGWRGQCHSVLVECKISRADFLADRAKLFRQRSALGLGCERYYLGPASLIEPKELPAGWGLLESRRGKAVLVHAATGKNLRSARGLRYEMNLLLCSLRRVEVRIEPQSITDFLKWKNRLERYNGGRIPQGIAPASEEHNFYLEGAEAEETLV
jgi:hypothetical protein